MQPTPPEPNDDQDISPEEIAAASEQIPTDVIAPELEDRTEQLTEWDTPPDATGTAAPKVLPEDAVSPVEQLVDEGTDEADRTTRQAAADPDFEP